MSAAPPIFDEFMVVDADFTSRVQLPYQLNAPFITDICLLHSKDVPAAANSGWRIVTETVQGRSAALGGRFLAWKSDEDAPLTAAIYDLTLLKGKVSPASSAAMVASASGGCLASPSPVHTVGTPSSLVASGSMATPTATTPASLAAVGSASATTPAMKTGGSIHGSGDVSRTGSARLSPTVLLAVSSNEQLKVSRCGEHPPSTLSEHVTAAPGSHADASRVVGEAVLWKLQRPIVDIRLCDVGAGETPPLNFERLPGTITLPNRRRLKYRSSNSGYTFAVCVQRAVTFLPHLPDRAPVVPAVYLDQRKLLMGHGHAVAGEASHAPSASNGGMSMGVPEAAPGLKLGGTVPPAPSAGERAPGSGLQGAPHEQLPAFVFPRGARIKSGTASLSTPRFHSFVVTGVDGKHRYGYALYYYRRMTPTEIQRFVDCHRDDDTPLFHFANSILVRYRHTRTRTGSSAASASLDVSASRGGSASHGVPTGGDATGAGSAGAAQASAHAGAGGVDGGHSERGGASQHARHRSLLQTMFGRRSRMGSDASSHPRRGSALEGISMQRERAVTSGAASRLIVRNFEGEGVGASSLILPKNVRAVTTKPIALSPTGDFAYAGFGSTSTQGSGNGSGGAMWVQSAICFMSRVPDLPFYHALLRHVYTLACTALAQPPTASATTTAGAGKAAVEDAQPASAMTVKPPITLPMSLARIWLTDMQLHPPPAVEQQLRDTSTAVTSSSTDGIMWTLRRLLNVLAMPSVPRARPSHTIKLQLMPEAFLPPALLRIPDGRSLNMCAGNYVLLLKCLSPANVVIAWELLLLDQRVVFVSSDVSVLAPVSEALIGMLFPLAWHAPYIPVCPSHLLGMLDCPTSFIMGVPTSLLPPELPEEVFIIDLDHDRITRGFHEPPTMPSEVDSSSLLASPHAIVPASLRGYVDQADVTAEVARRSTAALPPSRPSKSSFGKAALPGLPSSIALPRSVRHWLEERLLGVARDAGFRPGIGSNRVHAHAFPALDGDDGLPLAAGSTRGPRACALAVTSLFIRNQDRAETFVALGVRDATLRVMCKLFSGYRSHTLWLPSTNFRAMKAERVRQKRTGAEHLRSASMPAALSLDALASAAMLAEAGGDTSSSAAPVPPLLRAVQSHSDVLSLDEVPSLPAPQIVPVEESGQPMPLRPADGHAMLAPAPVSASTRARDVTEAALVGNSNPLADASPAHPDAAAHDNDKAPAALMRETSAFEPSRPEAGAPAMLRATAKALHVAVPTTPAGVHGKSQHHAFGTPAALASTPHITLSPSAIFSPAAARRPGVAQPAAPHATAKLLPTTPLVGPLSPTASTSELIFVFDTARFLSCASPEYVPFLHHLSRSQGFTSFLQARSWQPTFFLPPPLHGDATATNAHMRRHSSAGSEEDEVDTSSGNKLAGIVGVESRASPPSTSRRYLAAPSHAKPANSITNKVVADKLQFFDSCVDVQRRWPGDDGFGMEHCSLIEVGQYGPRVTATMYQRCICGADASALVRQLHSKAGALLPAGAARAKLANMMGQPLAAAPAHAVAGLVAVPPAVGPLAAGRGVKGTAPSAAVRETEAGDAIPPKAHTFGSRKPSAINMPMEHLLNEMRTRSSSTVDSGANELAVKDEAARGHRRVETIASDRVDSKRTTHLDRDAALALGAGSVDDMHVGADFMRGSEAGTNQRAVYACRFCGLSWQPHVIPNISPPLPLASGPMNTLDLDDLAALARRPVAQADREPAQPTGALFIRSRGGGASAGGGGALQNIRLLPFDPEQISASDAEWLAATHATPRSREAASACLMQPRFTASSSALAAPMRSLASLPGGAVLQEAMATLGLRTEQELAMEHSIMASLEDVQHIAFRNALQVYATWIQLTAHNATLLVEEASKLRLEELRSSLLSGGSSSRSALRHATPSTGSGSSGTGSDSGVVRTVSSSGHGDGRVPPPPPSRAAHNTQQVLGALLQCILVLHTLSRCALTTASVATSRQKTEKRKQSSLRAASPGASVPNGRPAASATLAAGQIFSIEPSVRAIVGLTLSLLANCALNSSLQHSLQRLAMWLYTVVGDHFRATHAECQTITKAAISHLLHVVATGETARQQASGHTAARGASGTTAASPNETAGAVWHLRSARNSDTGGAGAPPPPLAHTLIHLSEIPVLPLIPGITEDDMFGVWPQSTCATCLELAGGSEVAASKEYEAGARDKALAAAYSRIDVANLLARVDVDDVQATWEHVDVQGDEQGGLHIDTTDTEAAAHVSAAPSSTTATDMHGLTPAAATALDALCAEPEIRSPDGHMCRWLCTCPRCGCAMLPRLGFVRYSLPPTPQPGTPTDSETLRISRHECVLWNAHTIRAVAEQVCYLQSTGRQYNGLHTERVTPAAASTTTPSIDVTAHALPSGTKARMVDEDSHPSSMSLYMNCVWWFRRLNLPLGVKANLPPTPDVASDALQFRPSLVRFCVSAFRELAEARLASNVLPRVSRLANPTPSISLIDRNLPPLRRGGAMLHISFVGPERHLLVSANPAYASVLSHCLHGDWDAAVRTILAFRRQFRRQLLSATSARAGGLSAASSSTKSHGSHVLHKSFESDAAAGSEEAQGARSAFEHGGVPASTPSNLMRRMSSPSMLPLPRTDAKQPHQLIWEAGVYNILRVLVLLHCPQVLRQQHRPEAVAATASTAPMKSSVEGGLKGGSGAGDAVARTSAAESGGGAGGDNTPRFVPSQRANILNSLPARDERLLRILGRGSRDGMLTASASPQLSKPAQASGSGGAASARTPSLLSVRSSGYAGTQGTAALDAQLFTAVSDVTGFDDVMSVLQPMLHPRSAADTKLAPASVPVKVSPDLVDDDAADGARTSTLELASVRSGQSRHTNSWCESLCSCWPTLPHREKSATLKEGAGSMNLNGGYGDVSPDRSSVSTQAFDTARGRPAEEVGSPLMDVDTLLLSPTSTLHQLQSHCWFERAIGDALVRVSLEDGVSERKSVIMPHDWPPTSLALQYRVVYGDVAW